MSAKLLLLEDDSLFNETLQDFLVEEGYSVDAVLDPYSALDLTYESNYDLYLFDVNLPYESGFDLLSKLRQGGDETPVIFITSREDKASLAEGFAKGGDDYIKKPVDLEELGLRIEAIFRRQTRRSLLYLGSYRFDVRNRQLFSEGGEALLSQKAALLLLVLLEAKGGIVPIDQIKSRLWSTAEEGSDGSLRVYITQLKKYFPQQIRNERGVGYAFDREAIV